ncbi:MAG: MFS transporter, partial [Mucinivorans sp.]
MSQKQQTINYTGPFFTMVFLFFIVGFLTVVNQQFQSPLQEALLSNVGNLRNTLAVMVTFAWFLSYPLTGGIGARLVNKLGYKSTMVRALFVVAAGCAIFEASVLLQKYSGASMSFGADASIPYAYFLFLIGAYVVGAGVTIMQVVINPYLVACSVKGTSDVQRQNIGGSSNSIGTTLAPFFVGGIIFGGATVVTLDSLIIPFLAFIVVIMVVAFIITKLKLPNIANTTAGGDTKLERSIWSFRHLTFGVVAIFIYVGVEVCVGANLVMHAKAEANWLELAAQMGSLYWGGMLVGR